MTRKNIMITTILFLIVAAGWIGDVYSEPIAGAATFKKALFLSDTAAAANNSSATWVDAFSTTLTLKGREQCVAFLYSGEIAAGVSAGFRTLIDDEVAEGGADPYLAFNNNLTYETRTMNWWACGLGKGDHSVKIQFKPYNNTNVEVRKRSLIILYNN